MKEVLAYLTVLSHAYWLDGTPVQHTCIEFLHHILSARARLIHFIFALTFSGGYKEEEEEEEVWCMQSCPYLHTYIFTELMLGSVYSTSNVT